MIYPSGLKIVIDLSKPGGQRVQSIHARSASKGQEDTYEALDPTRYYTVIMNPYLLQGGNGFKFSNTNEYKTLGK